jgi:hypothetical protein
MKKRDRLNIIFNIVSVSLSGIAVVVSIIAIYFSGFYKSYDLNVSVVGSNQQNITDSFDVDILLDNRGNTHATILSFDITFSWGDRLNYYLFDSLGNQLDNVIYRPLVLEPGKQITRTLHVNHNFKEGNHQKLKAGNRNYYSVDLIIFFINNDGNQAIKSIPIGKLFFSDDNTIEELSLDYRSLLIERDKESLASVNRGVKVIPVDTVLLDSLLRTYKNDTLFARRIYNEIFMKRHRAKFPPEQTH